MKQKKLFISLGEKSADILAAEFIRGLSSDAFAIEGICGPQMRTLPVKVFQNMESFEVMGIQDILIHLPKLLYYFYRLRNYIIKTNPDAVLFIDQPALSIRLAKSLRAKGYTGKIIQCVAPSVWAYNSKRADEMAKYFDLLLTLFPFEAKYFSHTPLTTVFIGHPHIAHLIQNIQKEIDNTHPPLLAIFPGSRPREISRNLPLQLQVCKNIQKYYPNMQVGISSASNNFDEYIKQQIEKYSIHSATIVPFENRFSLMQKAQFALAKSGTITLELAAYLVPTIVTYTLSTLNYLYAKHILHLQEGKNYCIVNIIAEKTIFPELISKRAVSVEEATEALASLIANKEQQAYIKSECKKLCSMLHREQTPVNIMVEEITNLINN